MTLKGKVAVVAGATRGAGRGIASMLGEAGAVVYCTGRSSRAARAAPRAAGAPPFELAGRPETIEETAEMVTARGGTGIPVRVDHSQEDEVQALFDRVRAEHGRLDVLVNDIWGGDALTEWGKPFWELDWAKGKLLLERAVHTHILTSRHGAPLMVERRQGLIVEITEWGKPFWELDWAKGKLLLERAVHTHILTSRHGAPLMVERRQGLIVEITDGDSLDYRGNLFYDLAKVTAIRLAYAMAEELRPHNVTALAVTPGFLRSEAMLDHFGVTEADWQKGAERDPHFIASETPFYVGRAVAALAADPGVQAKTGKAFSSWDLAEEYGFSDIDGRRPHWGRYFAEHIAGKP